MDLDDDELKATRKAKGLERTADEMFENLGYEKIHENQYEECNVNNVTEGFILYQNEKKEITFWNDKTIDKTIYDDNVSITIQELQAIYKKCEELGWM